MEHLTLKAVTTTTDQGLFEAVISTETSDREKDIVSAQGMVDALQKWNRPLPLAWNHNTEAESIFGAIDPKSARVVDSEVVVAGQVDMESKVGKEAWRTFKSRTVGFSFGYLVLQARNIKGGGRNITELDVFEVTATPTPMNNDTRVLFTKAVDDSKVTVTYKTPPDAEVVIEEVAAVEDGPAKEPAEAKAKPQDPLVREAWELVLPKTTHRLPEPQVQEEPEPLDAAAVTREAWALALKTSGT